jgi:hypothetical protein
MKSFTRDLLANERVITLMSAALRRTDREGESERDCPRITRIDANEGGTTNEHQWTRI